MQVTEMPDIEAVQQDQWPDLRPLLDEELSRLPEIYRAVIVLCELEGRSRKETARQLGVPEGTVAGRLARARVMLAKRLTQRGVVLSGGALAAILSQNVASAGVPASVVSKTIKVASLLAAGQAAPGVISVKVAALTEGVLKTMFVTKIKSVLAVALVVGLLCGVAGMMYKTQAAEPPKEGQNGSTPTAQKADAPLPKATTQPGYTITSKLLEASPDKPKEILVLPKATAEDRQLIPIQVKDASPDSLAKMGGDDKLKIGTFLDVRVSSLDDKKVRLYCSFQKNEVEKSGDNNIRVVGSTFRSSETSSLTSR